MSININIDAKEIVKTVIKDLISVRSFITLGAFGTAYVLSWHSKPVPDVIIRIMDLLLGYWFGEKTAKAVMKINETTK